jgi:hypothetical protein
MTSEKLSRRLIRVINDLPEVHLWDKPLHRLGMSAMAIRSVQITERHTEHRSGVPNHMQSL